MAIGRRVARVLVGLVGCSDADNRDPSGVTVVDSFPPASDDDGSTSDPESDASDDDASDDDDSQR